MSEKNKKIERIYNLIILDESGSMSGLEKMSVDGVNETIQTIRGAANEHPEQKQMFSFITFSGMGDRRPYRIHTLLSEISEVKEMSMDAYRPCGNTPLWDTMGIALSALEIEVGDNDIALVTVITDGYENSSREYSGRMIQDMVKRLDKKGWVFTYIGANQDAMMEAGKLAYYTVESADGRVLEAKTVINCAGVFADEVYARLEGEKTMSFSIHPRTGEYLLLDKEYGKTVSRTVFRCPSKMGKGILVTPTVDGNLLLGPTATDIEDKSDTSVSAEGIAKVTRQATEQVKVNLRGSVITSFSGLRAVGSTGDFIIGFGHERFLNVAGIESPGLSASPAIAEYVISLLMTKINKREFILRADYTPEYRSLAWLFHEMTDEEKCAVIAKNSAFANMICRCEEITEGEIVTAIRRDPTPVDIDGIKRRTRASMGRCQGGFCVPVIVGILARELGVPEEDITKFGGGSYMLIGKTKTVEEA